MGLPFTNRIVTKLKVQYVYEKSITLGLVLNFMHV